MLEALAAEKRPMGPTEVANIVNLDKGTVSRFLTTLETSGYVSRDSSNGTYRLTAKLLRLSRGFHGDQDLQALAGPILQRLRDDAGETVHLGIREGEDQVIYIDKMEPEVSVRLASAVGETMPLFCTALGKAILFALPPGEQAETLAAIQFEPRTERTIMSIPQLRQDLEESRIRGFAIDDEENLEAVTCVAAPILGPQEDVLGAVSISSPTFRVRDRILELGAMVSQAASDISIELGAAVS